jgi:hypothetical protein
LRERVPPMPTDRFLAADLETARGLIADGTLLAVDGVDDATRMGHGGRTATTT